MVDPRGFTTGLMRAAKMHGAVLRHDTVVELVRGASAALRGVALASGEISKATPSSSRWDHGRSLLRAGCRWVWGCNGHSLVFETGETIPAEALFLEYREASGEILTPELFPRADGTTRVCAISTTGPVPVDPADVAPESRRVGKTCPRLRPGIAYTAIQRATVPSDFAHAVRRCEVRVGKRAATYALRSTPQRARLPTLRTSVQ